MEKMKDCRKLAILMDETEYELWDVCIYINAFSQYWNNEYSINTGYVRFMNEQTGFTRTKLMKFNRAMTRMVNNVYPLAKEYAMISNLIAAMDEEEFGIYNPEYYKETEEHFEETALKILEECSKNTEYEDLMSNGKIMENKENEAIRRYMNHNGFHIVS